MLQTMSSIGIFLEVMVKLNTFSSNFLVAASIMWSERFTILKEKSKGARAWHENINFTENRDDKEDKELSFFLC